MRFQAVINEDEHSLRRLPSRPAAASGSSLQAACGFTELQVSPSTETRLQQKCSTRQFQRTLGGDHVQLALRRQFRSYRHTFTIVVVQLSIQLRSKERIRCSLLLSAETAYGGQARRNSISGSHLCRLSPLPSTACFLCCAGDTCRISPSRKASCIFCTFTKTYSVPGGCVICALLMCFLFKSDVFLSKPACFWQSVESCLLKMSDFDAHLQEHL